MNLRRDRLSMVLITVAIAMVLTLLPIPHYLEFLRPYWVALVLIYWCLETQDLVSLGLAFTLGVVLDLLTGTLLGQHALSLVIIVYLVTRFRSRLPFFPPCQQPLPLLALDHFSQIGLQRRKEVLETTIQGTIHDRLDRPALAVRQHNRRRQRIFMWAP